MLARVVPVLRAATARHGLVVETAGDALAFG
jgi:hypothetical protein